eukprot:TRINITY_DN21008_c0_g2_i2.p2 TRINITY_DN21008_c0_g2~~TRINITY_DN21008_c0_g2_i2.p2  ORF type:complete len:123 (-),score=12.48 TRINITY_DN21008_c0_g2_i2:429-797(-)
MMHVPGARGKPARPPGSAIIVPLLVRLWFVVFFACAEPLGRIATRHQRGPDQVQNEARAAPNHSHCLLPADPPTTPLLDCLNHPVQNPIQPARFQRVTKPGNGCNGQPEESDPSQEVSADCD